MTSAQRWVVLGGAAVEWTRAGGMIGDGGDGGDDDGGCGCSAGGNARTPSALFVLALLGGGPPA